MYNKHHHFSRLKSMGFTIVELAVVISVIGVLAAISVVGYGAWRTSITQSQVKSDLNGVAAAMESARNFSAGYPLSLPSSFSASSGVVLTYVSGNAQNYCINGTTTANASINFYYDTTQGKTVRTGTCTAPTSTPPVITLPASNYSYESGGCGYQGYFNMYLYSTATGTPTPTIQWQRLSTKNTTTGTWINIPGATTISWTFDAEGIVDENDYMMFRAIWTSGSATSTSPTIQYYIINGC